MGNREQGSFLGIVLSLRFSVRKGLGLSFRPKLGIQDEIETYIFCQIQTVYFFPAEFQAQRPKSPIPKANPIPILIPTTNRNPNLELAFRITFPFCKVIPTRWDENTREFVIGPSCLWGSSSRLPMKLVVPAFWGFTPFQILCNIYCLICGFAVLFAVVVFFQKKRFAYPVLFRIEMGSAVTEPAQRS